MQELQRLSGSKRVEIWSGRLAMVSFMALATSLVVNFGH
jgi:hypothetical protein